MTVPHVREEAGLGSRAVLGLIECLPAFVVALLLLPFIIQYGSFSPWEPSTIDLQVYVYAVQDMLAGKNIFETTTPFWNLYFIYPPVAAVLMVPLAFGPYVMWQIIWTAGLVWAQQSVMKRCGVPRGWKLALAGVAIVVAMEPIRTTLGYGQVNTLLMALVVADLLPDAPGEKRRIPQGTLIGLAAAIKLTPALFVIFAFLIGKKKIALTGIISFIAFTGIGAIFLFWETLEFWGGLAGGDTRTASPVYVGNQSLLGVVFRLAGGSTVSALAGMAFAGALALLSCLVAAHWWRRGERVFAVALVGLATCLASPLSWTHHFVWILPLAVAVIPVAARHSRLPLWARSVAAAWVLWVCICLPLAALPYGGSAEANYTAGQQVIANLGPILGVVLVVGLAGQMISQYRSAVSDRTASG